MSRPYSLGGDTPIGLRLAQWRLEHRSDGQPMTQAELGKLIGYSQRQVSRIEREEVQLDAAEVDRVLAALGSIANQATVDGTFLSDRISIGTAFPMIPYV
jgi:transcriptional regulator with XRE-family HTH domain